MTTASDNDVAAVMLRSVITADPALKLDTYAVYAAAVAPDPTFNIRTSFAEIRLLVNVNDTAVAPANAALFIVIWPADLFSVTPVDLLVACVTVPCAAVE